MGIINDIKKEIKQDIQIAAGEAIVYGAIEAAKATVVIAEKTIQTGRKATKAVAKGVSDSIDRHNTALLKKENEEQQNYLILNRKNNLYIGDFSATSRNNEERYHTKLVGLRNSSFTLTVSSETDNNVTRISRKYEEKKGLFGKKKVLGDYKIIHNNSELGYIYASRDKKQKLYTTSFNDWIISGDFNTMNFDIFDRTANQTLAVISKKHKSATGFSIVCEHDENEGIFVAIAVLIDILEQK